MGHTGKDAETDSGRACRIVSKTSAQVCKTDPNLFDAAGGARDAATQIGGDAAINNARDAGIAAALHFSTRNASHTADAASASTERPPTTSCSA